MAVLVFFCGNSHNYYAVSATFCRIGINVFVLSIAMHFSSAKSIFNTKKCTPGVSQYVMFHVERCKGYTNLCKRHTNLYK